MSEANDKPKKHWIDNQPPRSSGMYGNSKAESMYLVYAVGAIRDSR